MLTSILPLSVHEFDNHRIRIVVHDIQATVILLYPEHLRKVKFQRFTKDNPVDDAVGNDNNIVSSLVGEDLVIAGKDPF